MNREINNHNSNFTKMFNSPPNIAIWQDIYRVIVLTNCLYFKHSSFAIHIPKIWVYCPNIVSSCNTFLALNHSCHTSSAGGERESADLPRIAEYWDLETAHFPLLLFVMVDVVVRLRPCGSDDTSRPMQVWLTNACRNFLQITLKQNY